MNMVIIDEISMVGPDTLYKVHRRMVEICQMEDMFGDRAVMFVGGKYVSKEIASCNIEILC